MSGRPRISIVIPHYRDLAGLDLCLTALEQQSLPSDQFEIIVADNNSPQGKQAVADLISGRAQLVVVTEQGAGPARNGGVALAKGEILAFTDSDCVPEPQWLARGVAALDHHDFIGGHVRVLLANPPHMTPTEAFERVFAFDFKTYIEKKGFTGAGNLFCPRALFDKVGGFKAGVSEDVEWSQRAIATGFRLGYAPDAIVGHPARPNWEELLTKWRRVNLETYGLLRTRAGGRTRWFLRSMALLPSALAHTPKVLMSAELNTFSQRLMALGVLYRLRGWRLRHALKLLAGQGV